MSENINGIEYILMKDIKGCEDLHEIAQKIKFEDDTALMPKSTTRKKFLAEIKSEIEWYFDFVSPPVSKNILNQEYLKILKIEEGERRNKRNMKNYEKTINKGNITQNMFALNILLQKGRTNLLNDKIYNVTPEDYSIESIIVFGSFIRGDNNIHSDIDFLIVIDNCSYNEKLITKLNIAEEMQIPPSWISIYTTDEIYDLCLYGDSFLWSIKIEGLILYSRSGFFEYCLYNLRLYTNMTNDIASNYKKLRNISYDFNTKTVSNATLIKRVGYIIRNTLTILAYTAGVINYNKYEVYDICKSIPGFYIPFSKESYFKLLDIKSYIKDNSLDADSIPNFHQYIKLWIKKAFLLVRSSYYKIIALTSRGFSSPFIDYL